MHKVGEIKSTSQIIVKTKQVIHSYNKLYGTTSVSLPLSSVTETEGWVGPGSSLAESQSLERAKDREQDSQAPWDESCGSKELLYGGLGGSGGAS